MLRDLPQWSWGAGRGYQAVRTVLAAAGNAAPDIEAGTVLTVYGFCHARDGADHDWTWDLARYRPLQTFTSPDARSYLVKLDALLGARALRPYTQVSPDALPRALDHLNVVWKGVTQQRLFLPRGLAGAASLVEPVISGDQLTARLGALADVVDLFMRAADGRQPSGGSLNAFRDQVLTCLPSGPGQDQARAAVGQLTDNNRIRNGRLHTDATNWAQAMQRLGIPSAEPPGRQWDRIRAVAVEAVYTLIELLQPLIL